MIRPPPRSTRSDPLFPFPALFRSRDAVAAAFAGAAHVSAVSLLDTRVAPVAMEPRGGIGEWDEAIGRYTLTAPTQGVSLVSRVFAAQVFGTEPDKVRRSEEDTSDIQSLMRISYAVFCLKKKT